MKDRGGRDVEYISPPPPRPQVLACLYQPSSPHPCHRLTLAHRARPCPSVPFLRHPALPLASTDGRLPKQFVDNVITRSTQRDIYLYPGADEPEVATGRCTDNVFE